MSSNRHQARDIDRHDEGIEQGSGQTRTHETAPGTAQNLQAESNLKREIDNMKSKYDSLQSKYEALQSRDDSLQQQMDQLRQEIVRGNQAITGLRDQFHQPSGSKSEQAGQRDQRHDKAVEENARLESRLEAALIDYSMQEKRLKAFSDENQRLRKEILEQKILKKSKGEQRQMEMTQMISEYKGELNQIKLSCAKEVNNLQADNDILQQQLVQTRQKLLELEEKEQRWLEDEKQSDFFSLEEKLKKSQEENCRLEGRLLQAQQENSRLRENLEQHKTSKEKEDTNLTDPECQDVEEMTGMERPISRQALSQIEMKLRATIQPVDFIPVICSFDPDVLTEPDKEQVQQDCNNYGRSRGASTLFDRIRRHEGWLETLMRSLNHPDVKLAYVAQMVGKAVGFAPDLIQALVMEGTFPYDQESEEEETAVKTLSGSATELAQPQEQDRQRKFRSHSVVGWPNYAGNYHRSQAKKPNNHRSALWSEHRPTCVNYQPLRCLSDMTFNPGGHYSLADHMFCVPVTDLVDQVTPSPDV